MKISKNELDSVTKLSAVDRYKYFIKKVVDSETLYSLQNLNNELATAEVENNKILSFWSAFEFAQECATGEWQNYAVVNFSLDTFNKIILRTIKAKGYLLNIFSVRNETGFVVDSEEFLRDISEEMQNYQ